jgi:hypothetical protein
MSQDGMLSVFLLMIPSVSGSMVKWWPRLLAPTYIRLFWSLVCTTIFELNFSMPVLGIRCKSFGSLPTHILGQFHCRIYFTTMLSAVVRLIRPLVSLAVVIIAVFVPMACVSVLLATRERIVQCTGVVLTNASGMTTAMSQLVAVLSKNAEATVFATTAPAPATQATTLVPSASTLAALAMDFAPRLARV